MNLSPFCGFAGKPFSSVSISVGSVCLGFVVVVEAVVYCGSAVTFGRSVRTVCAGAVDLLVDTVTAGLVVVDLVVSRVELVVASVSDSVGASTVVSELSLKIWTLYSFSPAS